MTYQIIQTEPCLWTVGTETSDGKWHPVSDHPSPAEARRAIERLNGGGGAEVGALLDRIEKLEAKVAELSVALETVYFNQ